MKSKIAEYSICALILIGILGFAGNLVYSFHINLEARAEMRHFMAHVPLNTTKSQLDKRFTEEKYQFLELRQGSNLWSVRTPTEFGTGNWLLYVEFDGDNLVALRMRTPDDMRFRPRDKAPADKVSASWKKPFPNFK